MCNFETICSGNRKMHIKCFKTCKIPQQKCAVPLTVFARARPPLHSGKPFVSITVLCSIGFYTREEVASCRSLWDAVKFLKVYNNIVSWWILDTGLVDI